MSATTGDEIYVYDSLGNRVTYTDQRNATTRAYANNVANEYASVATFAVTHDAAGNLSKQTVNGDGDAYVYTYDCDNRLLGVAFDEVGVGATALATFAYDALGRKITAWTQYDVAGGGGDSQTADLRFYHDGQAELADYHSDGTLARRFVNGTQYLDERVALIEGEADEADTFYYLLQELYTVTGLVEKNGALAEADVYDGYGKARLWDYSPGDFDRDGDVDATDQTTFTTAMGLGAPGTPTPDPSTDLDMDGDTDLTDAGLFTTIKNAGGAVAERFVSSLGNPFHFTGRRLYMLETLPEADATPVANQQLQHNRARHYSPLEGRWLQRDPMEYVDGAGLFVYGGNSPSKHSDPDGMYALPFVACCKYRTTTIRTGVGMGGTGSKDVSVSYATENCPVGARSPLRCCQRCPTKNSPWEQITRTPIRAWWGPCCFCTVTLRRGPGIQGYWPFHIILLIDCSDGRKWAFDHPQCNIRSLPYHTTPTEQQYPTIVSSFILHCSEVQSLVDEAQKMEDERPGYGFIQDCHWAVRELLRRWRERFDHE